MTASATLTPVPNFIGGEWQKPAATQAAPVFDPSHGEIIAKTPLCDAAKVNDAVEAAAAAFPAWSDTPPTGRARIFFRFKTLLEDRSE